MSTRTNNPRKRAYPPAQLTNDSHDCNHSKTSVAEFFVLVINPALIAVIHPVRSTEDVSWNVARALLDLLSHPLNSATSQDELKPSNKWELLSSLKRVAGKSTVESRVDTSRSDVPSQAGSHGNTPVLELSLTVMSHDYVRLSLGQTQWIEEARWRNNSDNGLIFPCGKSRARLGLGGWGKSSATRETTTLVNP